MADWAELSPGDQRELLLVAAAQTGRDPAILEKDLWVVWTLAWIGRSPWADDLVFKGGTSLSKVHRAIDRFSEDIDLTYDIRRLVKGASQGHPDPLPVSKSQADKWTDEARNSLRDWLGDQLVPALQGAAVGVGANVDREGEDVLLRYQTALEGAPAYLRTAVKLEFGGRATGEPADYAAVTCDLAVAAPEGFGLPQARIRTMSSARTFWEKVTAMHVHCGQTRPPAERFARHWFDVACLHRAALTSAALADRALARTVVEHKRVFFAPAAKYGPVDMGECLDGRLRILPSEETAGELRRDYEAMLDAGYLWGWRPGWDEVLTIIEAVEADMNSAAPAPQA